MGLMETVIDIPAEHEANVFGQFDVYAKKIEPDIYPLKMFALPLLHVGGAIILYYPLLNFWTLRWGILFVYLIIVLIKERFRIGTLVPVLAEKCSFFKEK